MSWKVYTDQYGQTYLIDETRAFPNNLLFKTLDGKALGPLTAIAEQFNEADQIKQAYYELKKVVGKYDRVINLMPGEDVMHFVHLMHRDKCSCDRIRDMRFVDHPGPSITRRTRITRRQRHANRSFARFMIVQREKRRRNMETENKG